MLRGLWSLRGPPTLEDGTWRTREGLVGNQEGPAQGGWKWPSEDDLSLVLRRLMGRNSSTRKTREARVRLANDERTRAFLVAGLNLIAQQFDAMEEHPEGEREAETDRPFFEWLSRKKVIQRASEDKPELVPSEGMFRDRWP